MHEQRREETIFPHSFHNFVDYCEFDGGKRIMKRFYALCGYKTESKEKALKATVIVSITSRFYSERLQP